MRFAGMDVRCDPQAPALCRVTRSGGPHAGPQASGGWGVAVERLQPPAAEDRRGVAQRQDPAQGQLPW